MHLILRDFLDCLTLEDGRLRLKCDSTLAETRFRLSAKRTSLFKSAGASVQSITGSRGLRISGSIAGYTMFRGSVKATGYPLHSPVSPSLPLPCVAVCHHISTGVYNWCFIEEYYNSNVWTRGMDSATQRSYNSYIVVLFQGSVIIILYVQRYCYWKADIVGIHSA